LNRHFLLFSFASGNFSKCQRHCSLSSDFCNELFGYILEIVCNCFIDGAYSVEYFLGIGLDDVYVLGLCNVSESYIGHFLYLIHKIGLSFVVEGDAYSIFTSSASSTGSVYVVVNFAWWLKLDDEINWWNVQSSGCYVGGNQTFYYSCFEVFECFFSVGLWNVPVKYVFVLFECQWTIQLVGLSLSLTEYYNAAVTPGVYAYQICKYFIKCSPIFI